MSPFPFSSFVYIFSGTTCLVYSFHYLRAWKKTRNEYSKMFWKFGLWTTFAFYLFGIPSLFYPEDEYFKLILYLISSSAIFIGITGPLQVALIAWDKKSLAGAAKLFVPLFAILLSVVNSNYYSPMFTDKYGLIHWNITYPFNLIWFAAGLSITALPAWFLLMANTPSQKAIVKKTLFSITFLLGGLGGWSTVFDLGTIVLAISWFAMFLGFLALAAMIFIEIFMQETNEAK